MKLKGVPLVAVRLAVAFIPLYALYYALFLSVTSYHQGVVARSTGFPSWIYSLLQNFGGAFDAWNNFTALSASLVVGLFGVPNVQSGNVIYVDVESINVDVIVDWSCNILLPYFSYLAMVLALLGISVRDRLIGLSGGLVLIYLGNVLRIATLAVAGNWFGGRTMNWYHDFVFNKGLAAWTMLVFLVWISLIGGGKILERSFGTEEYPKNSARRATRTRGLR